MTDRDTVISKALAVVAAAMQTVYGEAQERNTRWTSVKKGLPKETAQYQVALKTGGVTAAFYQASSGYFTIGATDVTYNVTHWMPMAEPPKED